MAPAEFSCSFLGQFTIFTYAYIHISLSVMWSFLNLFAALRPPQKRCILFCCRYRVNYAFTMCNCVCILCSFAAPLFTHVRAIEHLGLSKTLQSLSLFRGMGHIRTIPHTSWDRKHQAAAFVCLHINLFCITFMSGRRGVTYLFSTIVNAQPFRIFCSYFSHWENRPVTPLRHYTFLRPFL